MLQCGCTLSFCSLIVFYLFYFLLNSNGSLSAGLHSAWHSAPFWFEKQSLKPMLCPKWKALRLPVSSIIPRPCGAFCMEFAHSVIKSKHAQYTLANLADLHSSLESADVSDVHYVWAAATIKVSSPTHLKPTVVSSVSHKKSKNSPHHSKRGISYT